MHSAPAGFTERVMANLPEARSVGDEAPGRKTLFWLRFALGFAGVAITTVLAFEFLKEPEVEPVVALNAANESDASIAAVGSASAEESVSFPMPRITSEQLHALTTRLDQPLEKELENVISDTRLAIQFVASNFLPEK